MRFGPYGESDRSGIPGDLGNGTTHLALPLGKRSAVAVVNDSVSGLSEPRPEKAAANAGSRRLTERAHARFPTGLYPFVPSAGRRRLFCAFTFFREG